MDIKDLVITKRGQTLTTAPKAGVYYSIMVPQGADCHELRKDLAKAYPGAFFNLRIAPAPKAEKGKSSKGDLRVA